VIELQDHAEGCVLAVRAQPGARRNAVVGERTGVLKIAVTAPADRGRANQALEEMLADALGLKKSQVQLLSGPTRRDKRFLLRGLSVDQARARLTSLTARLE
jgi:uncharacterized protein (TIGR00251 family)